MAGYIYSGKDIAAEKRMAIEQCAKIADAVAVETGDGEGEIFIARKIADRIRALNGSPAPLDIGKVEAALQRAAHKAMHGTPEERSGRFAVTDEIADRTKREQLAGELMDWVERYAAKACPDGCLPTRAQEREMEMFARITRVLKGLEP